MRDPELQQLIIAVCGLNDALKRLVFAVKCDNLNDRDHYANGAEEHRKQAERILIEKILK